MATTRRRPVARRGAGPAERRADAALVERTLELLHAEEREGAASVRRVGAHVLEGYFGGDEDLARSHSPAKRKHSTRPVLRV